MFERFEHALDRAVAGGRVAGAVAMVVDRDGVTYHHAAGRRSLDAPTAMTPDSVFWLASMTKAVVSVAALTLVEQGKLSLDGDLAPLIPEFATLSVLEGFDVEGKPSLRKPKRPVTLRHLLTHTAGFGYGFINPQIGQWQSAAGAGDPTSGLRKDLVQPLLFDPGDQWAYGINTDWVGVAVEAASGLRLDAYLSRTLFAPLGMHDTGFARSADQLTRAAGMHARLETGDLAPIPFGMVENPEVLSGGGGLYSTAADYGRFLRMLLNGGALDGARVLSAETARSLGDVQTGALRAGAFPSVAPTISRDFDLYPDMLTGHGLATMITPHATGEGRSAGSLAWAGLGNTYYWADVEAGKAGLILTQILPFGDPDVVGLMRELERCAYGR